MGGLRCQTLSTNKACRKISAQNNFFAFVDPPTLKCQLSQRKTDTFLSLFRFAGIHKVE
ncbi:hypothetical protein PO909_005197 [Leuciscus waleckii]